MVKQVRVTEEIKIKRNKLIEKYNINESHAMCYLCNYGDLYFCNKFNGGCKNLERCNCISRGEKNDRKRSN